MDVKKRKYWSLYSKPLAPMKPKPPLKTTLVTERTLICEASSGLRLSEISLPPGTLLDEVWVGSDNGDSYIQFYLEKEVRKLNARYEQEMREWKKAIQEWKKKKEEYKEEVSQWASWSKAEKEGQKMARIRQAIKLLEREGLSEVISYSGMGSLRASNPPDNR